jgi:hypothetical protein
MNLKLMPLQSVPKYQKRTKRLNTRLIFNVFEFVLCSSVQQLLHALLFLPFVFCLFSVSLGLKRIPHLHF